MPEQHCIAVIHARGGSKRLPLKNIRVLHGKPLISWCIEAALGSKYLDRVIVSTDHDGIAEVALAAGAEVPFKRPAEIAEDVPSEIVTQHALEFHEKETTRNVDIVSTIQPTTPFIRSSDIDACINALNSSNNFDSAISVGPIHERPEWMYEMNENGHITSHKGFKPTGEVGISQTLTPLFMANGGIYATRKSALYEFQSVYGSSSYGHVMSRTRSVDIDDLVDFLLAETIARHLEDNSED